MENAAFPNGKFPGGKQPPLALLVEYGSEAYIPDVRFISLPAQSLSIANTLNGKEDVKTYFDNAGTGGAIRFTFPSARLLVVDDIATNLKVAEGLLAPYHAAVDTSLSGAKAIELVKQAASEKRMYDIVFMDHMMPEMDGIETTAAIRAWEKEMSVEFSQETPKQLLERPKGVPIIALTANAVMGMREMFIENGFNDFLAKPIDVSKLDEILDRWIPKEKRESGTGEKKPEKAEDGKKLIILVDDEPANLRLGKKILSEKYRVATAPSVEKMFILLKNNAPAMILLDIEMPETDGYAAIEALKSKPETLAIPVIFLIGANDSPDEEKGSNLGAVDYITKPFDPQALFACIKKHL
jgi:CheY-like chemotaxis protein